MKQVLRSALVVSSLVVGVSFAHAAPAKKSAPLAADPNYEKQLLEESPFDPSQFEFPSYTQEQFDSLKKLEASKRNPAGDVTKMISPEFAAVRDRFLKVKTADELDLLLMELNAKYDSFESNDTKMFAAQAVTLLPLRGVVWRLIPIAEKAKVTHSAILTMVKNLASGIGIFLPTQQWSVGFDYVSEPFKRGDAVSTQFETEGQFQAFLAHYFVQFVSQASQRIQKIDLKNREIVWDNKLLYGPSSFQDDLDRYRLVGELEKWAVLGNIHSTLAQLAFGRAYSVDGSISVAESLGRLYGIDGFLSRVEGAPARDRVSTIRSRKYANWGTLLPDGPKWTRAALANIRTSAAITEAIWTQLQKRPMNESWSVDPSFFQSRDVVRTGHLRIEDVVAMTKGPAKIRSVVTGETVIVNMPAFYENPPHDLKALFATQFNEEPEWKKMTFTAGGKSIEVQARNYDAGSPTNWDLNQYRSFLPEAKNGNDLKRAARVLSQSWGGSAALAPMLAFMN